MTPDLIVVNGALVTFDPGRPAADALAIAGSVIVAVGTTAEIRSMAGPLTREIDAAGGTVLPGFIDSHVHLFAASAELDFLNVHGVASDDAFAARVRPYAEGRPDDPLVMCVAADYGFLGPGRVATRHDLDAVLPDRPLAVFAADHHTLWANTAALERAGLLAGAQLPPGSEVVMGDDGRAAGQLKEPEAYGPVLALHRYGGRDLVGLVTGKDPVPVPTDRDRATDKAVIELGLRHCGENGVTGLHNMDGNFYQLELLSELEQEGRLPCRVQVPMHLKSADPLDRLVEAAEMRQAFASDRVWSGRVKMFMDGVFDSHTAFCLAPYPDEPGNLGLAMFEAAHFSEACIRADAMGLQISTHAIGDAAVRRTLDGYEAARRANGVRDSRHRIEHIEIYNPEDLPRFSELGVVASMQPLHAFTGGHFAPGPTEAFLRARHRDQAFAWRTLHASGAALVFSTDWPIVPLSPMRSIAAAVRTPSGDWPDQSLTLRDALAAYTRDNAWVEFNELRKGRLMPGYLADVVVLKSNLDRIATDALATVGVAATICDGNESYRA